MCLLEEQNLKNCTIDLACHLILSAPAAAQEFQEMDASPGNSAEELMKMQGHSATLPSSNETPVLFQVIYQTSLRHTY